MALGLWGVVAVGCASAAGGAAGVAPAANGGVTASAAAEEPRWAVTGQEVLEAGEHTDEWYFLGILDAWKLTHDGHVPEDPAARHDHVPGAEQSMRERSTERAHHEPGQGDVGAGCAWSEKAVAAAHLGPVEQAPAMEKDTTTMRLHEFLRRRPAALRRRGPPRGAVRSDGPCGG